MINREMLRQAISQIATNNIGTLQSVSGNTATVVIDGQVYPDVLVTSRLDLDKYVGEEVVVSFADKDNSNGIIVGVLGANNDLYTKEEVDNKIGGIDSIPGPKGDTGPPGPQGIPGEDGYTPVKGVDYFDGEPGLDGRGIRSIERKYAISNNRDSPTPIAMLPGGQELLAGNDEAGYFGEVESSELFTGEELANEIGLFTGLLQNNDEGWFKFAIDGKIIYKSKKAYKHSISWDNINSVGAVNGEAQVVKNNVIYKVRLMKGANIDPTGVNNGTINHLSEWNRLMLPIHEYALDQSWEYSGNVNTPTENWNVGISDNELGFGGYNGERQWVQERVDDTQALYRGWVTVTLSNSFRSNGGLAAFGWSPVLEVIGYIGDVNWVDEQIEPTEGMPYLWCREVQEWTQEPYISEIEPYLLREYIYKEKLSEESIIKTVTKLPEPNANFRGSLYILLSDNGDSPYVCIRKEDGTYAWKDMLRAAT